MTGDVPNPKRWPYHHRPARWRRFLLRRAALRAEWNVPPGPLGDVVTQLRKRGTEAYGRAARFAVLLFIVILVGLLFYLGLPFWQQFVDGRRGTLEETMGVLQAENAALDKELAEIQLRLVQVLKGSADLVPSGTDQFLRDAIAEGDRILLYGDGGAITRSTDGGASFDLVASGTDRSLWRAIAEGDRILLYGDGGAITRSTDGGASFDLVPSGTDQVLRDAIVDGIRSCFTVVAEQSPARLMGVRALICCPPARVRT